VVLRKKNKKRRKTWRGLSEQINSDTPSSILYLSKMLKIQWDGEVAIALANKCHELAQIHNDPKVRIKLAYRGFATLGVKLTEPDLIITKNYVLVRRS
jgi:hypothetical protein